jgi:prephenate dehydratase
MKAACLGPYGTFSHEMAMEVYGDDILLLPTIGDVFAAVINQGCPGIVPVENSDAGAVGPVMDCLREYPVSITGEGYLQIHHHLAARNLSGPVTVIYAHPQAHDQCRRVLETLGAEIIHTSSNSASARIAAESVDAAAVTTRAAALHEGLVILQEDIQNSRINITRFIRIERSPALEDAGTKCSLIIDPGEDRPGLLYEILGIFYALSLNLTRIESRPSKRDIGNYVFFIDVEVGEGLERALSRVREIAEVKNLGCYGRIGGRA